jgi:hypothetical protein
MREPSARSLSQLFSQLTDRHISFTLEPNAAAGKAPTIFATYSELPGESPIVARAERAMIAILGGALLGMPDETAIERALETPMNEAVRDAMHEILNIGSTALSTEGRVVLKGFVSDPLDIPHVERGVLSNPRSISTYRVAIDAKARGTFTLFS